MTWQKLRSQNETQGEAKTFHTGSTKLHDDTLIWERFSEVMRILWQISFTINNCWESHTFADSVRALAEKNCHFCEFRRYSLHIHDHCWQSFTFALLTDILVQAKDRSPSALTVAPAVATGICLTPRSERTCRGDKQPRYRRYAENQISVNLTGGIRGSVCAPVLAQIHKTQTRKSWLLKDEWICRQPQIAVTMVTGCDKWSWVYSCGLSPGHNYWN